MDQQRLSSLRPGESCRVLLVEGKDRQIRRRLFDMGVTPGAEIYVRKTAPLGKKDTGTSKRVSSGAARMGCI